MFDMYQYWLNMPLGSLPIWIRDYFSWAHRLPFKMSLCDVNPCSFSVHIIHCRISMTIHRTPNPPPNYSCFIFVWLQGSISDQFSRVFAMWLFFEKLLLYSLVPAPQAIIQVLIADTNQNWRVKECNIGRICLPQLHLLYWMRARATEETRRKK